MATIGQQLLSPEAGWQRIDFTFPMANVEFETGWQILTNASLYGGNAAYLNNGTIEDGKSNKKAKFKFKGTKIRIITTFFIAGNSIYISIDGNINTMNTYKETASHQTLGFEQLGLQDTVHDVEVWTDTIPTGIYLDAIDIDSTGKLVNPKEKTSLSEMQIGDMISCEYVATSGTVGGFSNLGSATKSLIPTASSATPDGSFYFVHSGYDHKGRMKLIADRNIQHSISWNVLNAAGIASELPIKFPVYKDAIPLMGSNNDEGITISTNNNNELDYILFDKSTGSSLMFSGGTFGHHIKVSFASEKLIGKYAISAGTTNLTQLPKTWTFNGSNDDINWVTLDSKTNITTWAEGVTKEFIINNNTAFKYYRINIEAVNGASKLSMNEFYLYEEEMKEYNHTIRLLTGGAAAADQNNEWYKIIVSSSLNGTITPGDNNIWNWNVNVCSWCSTVAAGSATNRQARGWGGNIHNDGNDPSSTVSVGRGFRPMLIVESLNSSKNRFLILDAGKYKTIIDGVLTTVCNETDPDEVKFEAFNQGLLTPGEFINYFENLESSSIKLLRFLASQ